jgi:signal transduction histidine kinase
MKPGSWACSRLLAIRLLIAWAALAAAPAAAVEAPIRRTQVLVGSELQPPADADPRWHDTALPDIQRATVAWYRLEFDAVPSQGEGMWVLYVPYLYGGGRIWLDGQPVASVLESNATRTVRWERPLLLPLPRAMLREGRNVLHVRPAAERHDVPVGLSRLEVGTQDDLQSVFERRLFFVRTVPVTTAIAGIAVGIFSLFIWLRRRQEVLYGLFGLGAGLWALRTLTFVFDSMPANLWPLWRLLYHATTGGFIMVMTLFTLAVAGWYRRGIALGLFAYWLLGPLTYVLAGAQGEELVGRWWAAGLIPIGLAMVVITGAAAWRRRNAETVVIATAVALAVAAGVHDYLVAWRSPLIAALFPRWTEERFFLLHYGANLLLLVMGGLLAVRFVRSLLDAEEANRTLEARVAAREQEISATYRRIAALQREQAATDERQRIMQDLHDGLGSQLFTSLLRAERGALDGAAVIETLRRAIDEMRIAIEALASDEQDFRTAFGNFRFRWEQRLSDAGVASTWQIEVPDAVLAVPPHDALQLLRIAQEALTNVLKHARARRVRVRLGVAAGQLELEVQDDGIGPATSPSAGGRGLANMRARAHTLGARLQFAQDERGTRVGLTLAVALAPPTPDDGAADAAVPERPPGTARSLVTEA